MSLPIGWTRDGVGRWPSERTSAARLRIIGGDDCQAWATGWHTGRGRRRWAAMVNVDVPVLAGPEVLGTSSPTLVAA